jgi:hypothetical protein
VATAASSRCCSSGRPRRWRPVPFQLRPGAADRRPRRPRCRWPAGPSALASTRGGRAPAWLGAAAAAAGLHVPLAPVYGHSISATSANRSTRRAAP